MFCLSAIGLGWAEYEANSGGPTNLKEAEFIARFGLGLDLYLLESVALQASSSYVLPTGDLEDLSYVSVVVGLQYRFGVP